MPKKGQAQPWKVRFQYPGQVKASTHSFSDVYSALRLRRDILRRGGEAELLYKLSDGTVTIATDDIVNAVLREHGDSQTWAEIEVEAGCLCPADDFDVFCPVPSHAAERSHDPPQGEQHDKPQG